VHAISHTCLSPSASVSVLAAAGLFLHSHLGRCTQERKASSACRPQVFAFPTPIAQRLDRENEDL
jgi:hypothetical protein